MTLLRQLDKDGFNVDGPLAELTALVNYVTSSQLSMKDLQTHWIIASSSCDDKQRDRQHEDVAAKAAFVTCHACAYDKPMHPATPDNIKTTPTANSPSSMIPLRFITPSATSVNTTRIKAIIFASLLRSDVLRTPPVCLVKLFLRSLFHLTQIARRKILLHLIEDHVIYGCFQIPDICARRQPLT